MPLGCSLADKRTKKRTHSTDQHIALQTTYIHARYEIPACMYVVCKRQQKQNLLDRGNK